MVVVTSRVVAVGDDMKKAYCAFSVRQFANLPPPPPFLG
jgi:hypothetical protein